MSPSNRTRSNRARIARASLLAGTLLLAACSSGTSTTSATTQPTGATAASTDTASPVVLPVTSNPITNTATAANLKIDKVKAEDNVDAKGKAVADHLEIALSNTGTTSLTGFEIYYTFKDPKTSVSESYYLKLPADFTIPANAKRTVHLDNTGAPDHFPVNKFSLYHTDKNAFDITVVASAQDAAIQTATISKAAGGSETAD
jgi:hypothetical protein